jgi:hypothetical protein
MFNDSIVKKTNSMKVPIRSDGAKLTANDSVKRTTETISNTFTVGNGRVQGWRAGEKHASRIIIC